MSLVNFFFDSNYRASMKPSTDKSVMIGNQETANETELRLEQFLIEQLYKKWFTSFETAIMYKRIDFSTITEDIMLANIKKTDIPEQFHSKLLDKFWSKFKDYKQH